MVSRAAIEEAIGPVEVGSGAESPGQHAKHYSPRTPVYLGDAPSSGNGVRLDFAVMPRDPAAYAETLYRTLHDLDQKRLDWIAIAPPPDTPEWDAVHDRLRRAARRGS
jgi:L-threonylcarbamoyladenylate synthase